MRRTNQYLTRLVLMLGLVALPTLTMDGAVFAQPPERYIEVLRSYPVADFGVGAVAGLTYSAQAGAFLLLEAPGAAARAADTTRAVMVTPYEDPAGEVAIPASAQEVQNTAFDARANRLVMFDQASGDLITIPADGTGRPEQRRDRVARFNGRRLGVGRGQGIAVNQADGRLFILDAQGRRLVSVTPDAQGNLDGPGSSVGQVNLGRVAGQLRGLTVDPTSGHLFVLSPTGRRLFELTETGDLVSTRNLARLGLRDPQAILIAPSADGTDDPAAMNLFVADGGNGVAGAQIVELAIEEPLFTALADFTPSSPTLVRTIDTSKAVWNPSSPDPSGIAFQPSTGRLLISDGEVEENHPDFQGVNVFVSTLGGSLTGTCNTLAFSNEPTGMGVNPANGRIFFSDDNQDRIYEINLGPDNQYCTGDDTRTFVNLSTYGTIDAESVAIGNGVMYIGDGVGAETWVIPLGPNGVLGGGDDGPVSHWDTFAMGLRDPEGIEYNPDTGTLYIVSTNSSDRRIVEATTTGTVVRILDITFLGSVPRSGLAYAPGSQNPDVRSLYMANRGVDNGADPNENDGKIYEIAVGSLSGGVSTPTNTATNTPTNTATNTPTNTATNTPTNTATNTPTNTATNTPTETPVPPTNTPTDTPTNTPEGPTNTPTNTSTPTDTSTPTNTPTDTNTPTNTSTPTDTSTPTNTSTPTDTSTPTNTPTDTNTPTNTSTPTDTSTPTNTSTPTSTPTGVITLTFGAAADTYVQQNTATTNYGAATSVNVDASARADILFKFTVTGVSGRPVTSVKLRLYCIGASVQGGSFYRVADSGWVENTVNWNTVPAADATAIASLGAVAANTYYEVDLTSLITGDGTYSLRVISTNSDGADYASKERSNAAQRPLLTINAGGGPVVTNTPTPVGPTSTPTNTATPSNTPTNTPTSTPTIVPTGVFTLTFGAAADTYVQQTTATTNYGAATSVNVDASARADILLKFTVTGVSGRPVTSVKLRLYCIGSSNLGGSFYRVADTSWVESTVNWNTVPAADATAIASLGAVATNTYYEVDLTSLITGDGTYSLRVISTSTNGADYASKERSNAAQRPLLTVNAVNP